MQGDQTRSAIARIELVMKESILGYYGNDKLPFLRITVTHPRFINSIKRMFEAGLTLAGIGTFSEQTFESNIAYLLRFMIDCDVALIANGR